MKKITLYRYTRADGGVSVSPVQPAGEYTVLYRLVAEDGSTLTDGSTVAACVDTDEPDKWAEIVETDTDETAAKAAAYDVLMGVRE